MIDGTRKHMVLLSANVFGGNYGTFAPKNFRSRERKYHGMELSLPGTFAPGSESSKHFRSLELSLPGTFVPGSENSKNFRSHAK